MNTLQELNYHCIKIDYKNETSHNNQPESQHKGHIIVFVDGVCEAAIVRRFVQQMPCEVGCDGDDQSYAVWWHGGDGSGTNGDSEGALYEHTVTNH